MNEWRKVREGKQNYKASANERAYIDADVVVVVVAIA
jgi:hypothetical protein